MQRRRVGEEGEAREGGGGEWERKERRVGMGGKWEESGGYTTNFILSTLNISSSDKEQGKRCEKDYKMFFRQDRKRVFHLGVFSYGWDLRSVVCLLLVSRE